MLWPLATRAFLAAALAIVLIYPQSAVASVPRVLLICQAGTVKSAITREYLRRRSAERGVAVSVVSRGIEPADHVSPGLRERLFAESVDPLADPVRKLVRRDFASADIIVRFDPLPVGFKDPRVRDWSSVPSMNESFERARADILVRIDALLDEIAAAKQQE